MIESVNFSCSEEFLKHTDAEEWNELLMASKLPKVDRKNDAVGNCAAEKVDEGRENS